MTDILLGTLAGFISGVAGSMGLGGGSVLIIYLTLFMGIPQLKAQGINLIFFLPIAALSVGIYAKRKNIKWGSILPIMIFGAIGTAVSGMVINFLNADWLRVVFGGFIIAYGLLQIFAKSDDATKEKPRKNGGDSR